MPFQVSQQTFFERKEPITLITAGEDRTFICSTGIISINLIPTVIGNLAGHTFEWELVSFNGNFLLPLPNATTGSTFSVFAPGLTHSYDMQFGVPPIFTTTFSSADMIWKFFVDRGQPEEQCDSLVIFFTPTSQLGTSILPPAQIVNPLQTVSSTSIEGKGRTIIFGSEDRRVRNFRLDPAQPLVPTSGGGHVTDKFLTWTYGPDSLTQFVDITIFENLGGTFVPVQTITDPEIRFFTSVTTGGSYKIIIRQDEGIGTGKSSFITERELGPVFVHTAPTVILFAPLVASITVNPAKDQIQINNFDVLQRSIKLLSIPPVAPAQEILITGINLRPQNNSIRVDNFDILIRTNKFLSIPPDFPAQVIPITGMNLKPQNNSIRVDNFGVLDLNGGAIGGG